MDRGDETPGPTLELALHTLTCDSESKSCFPFCFRPLLFVPSHLEFSLLSPLLARRQPDPLLHSPGTPGAAHTHSHCCLNANVARASSWHPLWKDKAESVCPQTSQECAEKIICGAWVETLHSSWARSYVLPPVTSGRFSTATAGSHMAVRGGTPLFTGPSWQVLLPGFAQAGTELLPTPQQIVCPTRMPPK